MLSLPYLGVMRTWEKRRRGILCGDARGKYKRDNDSHVFFWYMQRYLLDFGIITEEIIVKTLK